MQANTLGLGGDDKIYFTQSPAQRVQSNSMKKLNPYADTGQHTQQFILGNKTNHQQMSLSNISKPTASFGMAQFSHQQMSGKTSDSVFNLNQHGGRLSAKQLQLEDNFTGRLT